jgi:CBS domain-containing protein
MTKEVLCANVNQTVNECLSIMTEKRIRHLPVVVDGSLIGMLSIGDLVKAIIAEQRQLIEQLEQYIRG